VNLGISGDELKSTENHVIPYTLYLGEAKTTMIKQGYPSGNQPSDTFPTPSQLTQLYTTTAPVYLTIPGSVSDYPAGAYTGTITFTLGAK
jgi:spore coat protein U-like protein